MTLRVDDRVRIKKVAEAFRKFGLLKGDLGTVIRVGSVMTHVRIDGKESDLKSVAGKPYDGSFVLTKDEYEQVQAG